MSNAEGIITTWRTRLPLILVGGLLGLAIHVWLAVPIYPGLDLVFGSIPVMVVALVAGWQAGVLASLIAGAGTYWLWGHPIAWLIYPLQAVVLGRWGRTLHPSMLVAAFWLVVGLPAYLLLGRLGSGEFTSSLGIIAIKTPLQEVFCSLVALNLLFLATFRQRVKRLLPQANLPVVSLQYFQLSFVSMLIMALTGSMLLTQLHHFYGDQRNAMSRFTRIASEAVSAKLGAVLQGYRTTTEVTASLWDRLSPTERYASAQSVLQSGRFQGFAWLSPDLRVREGWILTPDGRLVSLPRDRSFSLYRPMASQARSGHSVVEVHPHGVVLNQPLLVILTPVVGSRDYIVASVALGTVQTTLQGAILLTDSSVALLDRQGHPMLSAGTPGPPREPLGEGMFNYPAAQAPIVSRAPVDGTGWQVQVTTPAWVVRQQVASTMRDSLGTMLILIVVFGALALSLMIMVGQELRQVALATRRLGHPDEPLPDFPESFLREIRTIYHAFRSVALSLKLTMEALRTREAELTLSNGQLEATVDDLKELDRNRSEVLNTLSHDIKIPLTAVIGYTELLEEEASGPLTGEQHSYVKGIDENSQRVIRLLEDLLDLARLDVGRFPVDLMPVDLQEALERTARNLQPLIARQRLSVRIEASEGMPPVLVDPGRLDQVLNNLVSNALKFTPPGGCITLRGYPSSESNEAVVQVIDTGVGIAPEHLPHLFERFYRVRGTQAPGTGLGLAISKKLLEAMGGHIGVVSQPGKGSTFWFTLPWAARVTEGAAVAGHPGRLAPHGDEEYNGRKTPPNA